MNVCCVKARHYRKFPHQYFACYRHWRNHTGSACNREGVEQIRTENVAHGENMLTHAGSKY